MKIQLNKYKCSPLGKIKYMKQSLVILLQNECYYWGYDIFRYCLLMYTFF